MYGLKERDLHFIRQVLSKFPEIEQAILFGSHAMGNYKKSSDVDLAIVGEKVSHKTMIRLNEWLNEINPIPFTFNLLHHSLSNKHLKKHIDR